MERVGLGFAGVGWLGESLLKEVHNFPSLYVAAVQDANAELAAEIADRYASPWNGADYQEMLRAPGVDAVVISTPNAFHAAQAQAAFRAGKHALVQKPLATTSEDARATVELALATHRLLFVDYSYRYLETVQWLLETARTAGPLNRLHGVFHNIYGPGKAWFFDPELSGGGAMVDLGVHLLDLGLHLVEPTHANVVRADLTVGQGQSVESAAAVDFAFDAVPFRLEVSWNTPLPLTEISLTAQCAGSTVRWENVDGSFFRFRTIRDGECLLERETTLREDTLRAFAAALAGGAPPAVDLRVYDLLADVYRRGNCATQ